MITSHHMYIFALQASRPGFFRQNSARSFKLLDLRRANSSNHSTSSGGVSSPPHLSPPATPSGPEPTSWLPGDPYNRTCRRIPTVCIQVHFKALYALARIPELEYNEQSQSFFFVSFCFTGCIKNQQHLWSADWEETSAKDLPLRWDKLWERWWCWNDLKENELASRFLMRNFGSQDTTCVRSNRREQWLREWSGRKSKR